MSAYLGTPGRLVPIYSTPSMGVSGMPARVYATTLEGRVKAQIVPQGRRQWDLTAAGASPTELGNLRAFASGEWGHGPFVWVSPTASVVNLLTPDQGSCHASTLYTAGVTATGPLSLGVDGWAGRSFTNATPATTFYFGSQGAPVLTGVKVTASAYLVGAGAAVQIRWADAAGTFISFSTGTASGVAGVAKRLSVTATPPGNAALAQVQAVNAAQGARPALTWTDELLEWGGGEGCPAAVVDEVSRTALGASNDPDGWRGSDVTFRIKEVG